MDIDSDQWRQSVIDGAFALGLEVSDDQARTMGRHALELLQWNRITNLTTITDPLDVALKHYVDAVVAAPWIGTGTRVLDAGSGGGFPGIPLKIVRPDLSITMVDSVRKKVSFLKHAVRTLELSDISAIHGRLEDLGVLPQYREKFDLVVCRAFSSMEDFVGLGAAFLAPGGSFLALKGRGSDQNHRTVNRSNDGLFRFGGTVLKMKIHRYRLPILNARRQLVLLTRLPEN